MNNNYNKTEVFRNIIFSCLAASSLCSSSFGYLSAQNQTSNTINNDDMTVSNNSKTITFETFFADGLISSLILDGGVVNISSLAFQENPVAQSVQYIIAGYWSLDVIDQTIKNFEINFTMVHPDGSDWHYHEISNFNPDSDIPILLDEEGTTFTGMTDIGEDNMDKWFGVQTTVIISNLNTITIFLDPADTDDHFNGQPIYGIIQSLMDKNGSFIERS